MASTAALFRVEISTAFFSAVDSWPETRASLASVAQAAGRKQIASGLSLDRPGHAIWADLLPSSGPDTPREKTEVPLPPYGQDAAIAQAHHQSFDVVRFIPAPNCEHFLEFTLKVQNFDVWMAAFDHEGAAQRANDGLIDEVVARGVEDPSAVHLVFLVSDPQAARSGVRSARRLCFSPEATVLEPPAFEFFRWTGAGTAG